MSREIGFMLMGAVILGAALTVIGGHATMFEGAAILGVGWFAGFLIVNS